MTKHTISFISYSLRADAAGYVSVRVCSECGALVHTATAQTHLEWHEGIVKRHNKTVDALNKVMTALIKVWS